MYVYVCMCIYVYMCVYTYILILFFNFFLKFSLLWQHTPYVMPIKPFELKKTEQKWEVVGDWWLRIRRSHCSAVREELELLDDLKTDLALLISNIISAAQRSLVHEGSQTTAEPRN